MHAVVHHIDGFDANTVFIRLFLQILLHVFHLRPQQHHLIMANLFGELRYAIGIDLYRQAPLFGFGNHFFHQQAGGHACRTTQHNFFHKYRS